jgi:myo-inositol catabolism protein IolC
VGKTVFWDPLVAWHAKSIAPDEAVAEVARRFHDFVDVFERAQPKEVRVS